jgi:lysophospholipase L1-like esterase
MAPHINSYGMVGKEYRLKKEKNTFRILILGDSITEFDWYVRSLEKQLNSNSKLGYNFEIWNGGVCGYEVNQYLNYLRYKGLRYNPDMVIIGFCLNDFNRDSMVVFYKDSKGFTQYYYPTPYLERIMSHNRFLFKHSYLYRFLIVKLETLLSQMHQEEKDINIRERTGLYYLGKIKRICNSKEIPLFCVIFPYLKPINEYDSSQKDEYNSMVRVLRELNIDYLDLHLYFPEAKRYELRHQKSDYIHPSREGHIVAATAIYKHLVKNYF